MITLPLVSKITCECYIWVSVLQIQISKASLKSQFRAQLHYKPFIDCLRRKDVFIFFGCFLLETLVRKELPSGLLIIWSTTSYFHIHILNIWVLPYVILLRFNQIRWNWNIWAFSTASFVQWYDCISNTKKIVTNVRLNFSLDICMTMFW